MNVPKQDDQPTSADREVVVARWPDAHCAPYSNANYPQFYCIRGTRKEWALTIGEGATPELAWADAAAKLAQPEEPQENTTAIKSALNKLFKPTPARVEHLIQPSIEDYQRADEILRIASAWKQTKDSLIQLLHRAYANQEFMRRTQRVEQPASEGGGAGDQAAATRLTDEENGILAELAYGNPALEWLPDAARHALEMRQSPTPPATGEAAPVGDVEQAELPPPERARALIEAYDNLHGDVDFRRIAKSLAEQMFTEREHTSHKLRAERAAHKATREELEDVIQKNRGLAEINKEMGALVDKACDAGEKSEAENQELRRKVEALTFSAEHFEKAMSKAEAELATMREDYGKACETIARLTAKEGQ